MMARRLTGLAILLGILLIFAPWLHKTDPPVAMSIEPMPKPPSSLPAITVPDTGTQALPTKALLSALGVDDVNRPTDAISNTTAQPVLKRPSAPVTSVAASKAYRVRLGVFQNPVRALLRFKSGGYSVVQEKHSDTDKGTLYAIYSRDLMSRDTAVALSDEINHRYDMKTLVEKYRP